MLINAIVIPVIRQEIGVLENWIQKCPNPGFQANFYFSIDDMWAVSEKRRLTQIFRDSYLKNSEVHFIDCEIEKEQSFYKKDKVIQNFDSKKYPYGLKSGPNIQFFRTIRALKIKQSDISGGLLLEVDAHPLKKQWLLKLNQRIQWIGDCIYIAGSRPVIAETMPYIRNHINGNAIYNIGKSDFLYFFSFWENLLIESVKINPDLAYDVVLEWSFYMSKFMEGSSLCKIWNSKNADEFRNGIVNIANLLSNLSGYSGSLNVEEVVTNYLEKQPDLIIIHGKYLNTSGEDFIWELAKQRSLRL